MYLASTCAWSTPAMIHPYVLNSLFSRCHFDCCVLLSVSSKCTFICIHKYTSGAANMSCVLFVSNIVLCICICICICISAMAFAFACACKCSWYNWWVLNPLWRLKVPSEGLLFEEDGWAGRQPQLLLPGGSRKCISAFCKCICAVFNLYFCNMCFCLRWMDEGGSYNLRCK